MISFWHYNCSNIQPETDIAILFTPKKFWEFSDSSQENERKTHVGKKNISSQMSKTGKQKPCFKNHVWVSGYDKNLFFMCFNHLCNTSQLPSETKSTSWWFQPSWKIFVKIGILPNFRGESKKKLSCHHLFHTSVMQFLMQISRVSGIQPLKSYRCRSFRWQHLTTFPESLHLQFGLLVQQMVGSKDWWLQDTDSRSRVICLLQGWKFTCLDIFFIIGDHRFTFY